MPYDNIHCATAGGIATLTVDRPRSLNALNPATLDEIALCVAALRADPSIRCLIVTGAGDKAFIAGADIGAMVSMSAFDEKTFAERGLALLKSFETLPIPVIAAVNGYALGGGTELALACDLIVAAEHARFGLPEINLGIIPGFGGTQRLARRIGLARAREMIFGGEMIDARTAHAWGLVNHVHPADALMGATVALAERFAAKAPLALRQAKLAINTGIDLDLDSGCRFETEAVALTFGTADKREGMSAFLEKRPAVFTGS